MFKKVIEKYFGKELEVEVLASASNNKKEKRDEAYSLISFFIDLVLTMSELGILNLKDSKILESFRFKADWLTSNRLNKKSLKFLSQYFETEKYMNYDLFKKFMSGITSDMFRGNPYCIYEFTYIEENYNNIIEAVIWEFNPLLLDKIIKEIEDEELHLILIKRSLETSVAESFENKFFKIANSHSCMRSGGCYSFYNNTGIDIYPCVIIDKRGKIRGRILYVPEYKLFLNGYEPNKGSYPWKELVSKYFETDDLYKENVFCGYVSNTYRIYIDFIISKNWSDVDQFLEIFNCISCCICEYSMSEDDAYISPDGEIYCEDCFYENHRYCDTCDEYHNINDVHMVHIPERDICTCDFEIIS